MPSSIPDAARLDHENGNTLWMDALHKEMSAVMIAFEVQPEKATYVPGYKKILGHIIWDVKIDFTSKARYLAGGHPQRQSHIQVSFLGKQFALPCWLPV